MSKEKTNIAISPFGSHDADALLEAARNANLEQVVIIGWEKESGELHIGTSYKSLVDAHHITAVGANVLLNMTLSSTK